MVGAARQVETMPQPQTLQWQQAGEFSHKIFFAALKSVSRLVQAFLLKESIALTRPSNSNSPQ